MGYLWWCQASIGSKTSPLDVPTVSLSSGSSFPTIRKPLGLHSCRPGMTITFTKIFDHFLSHMWSSHELTPAYTYLQKSYTSLWHLTEKCILEADQLLLSFIMQQGEAWILSENCVKNSMQFPMALGKQTMGTGSHVLHIAVLVLWCLGNVTPRRHLQPSWSAGLQMDTSEFFFHNHFCPWIDSGTKK